MTAIIGIAVASAMVVTRTVVASESAVVRMVNASTVEGVETAPLMEGSGAAAPMKGATTVNTATPSTTKAAVLCQ
jgi:hypothetical protein